MRALPLCLALLAVLIFVRPAFAAEETKWETFHSPTGVYSVNLPDEYKVETRTFRTAPGTIKDREGRVVNSEEVIARFDQRPYRKAVKNYIMRLDQTIGPNMTIPDVKRAIQKEMVNYINHYRKKGALITRKEILKRKAFWSGEIDLVYEDPELGVQGVKIRILFSDNTKLQQIFAGPEYLLEDKWVVDFF
ncbi:MAG: hypothetical protein K9G62_08895, partial [Alphaproteobacteria bacterium]|nr:hypothetical protein [Alphaproteobacteria bacterium]